MSNNNENFVKLKLFIAAMIIIASSFAGVIHLIEKTDAKANENTESILKIDKALTVDFVERDNKLKNEFVRLLKEELDPIKERLNIIP